MPNADVVRLTGIDERPLSVDAVLAAVRDAAAGGTALFVGTVRDHDPGAAGTVTGLHYEAHPDATAVLAALAAEVADAAGPQLRAVAAVHRTGDLAIGELAVVVAAAAEHRAEAFAAARTLIDRLKAEVPIWKRQDATDGSAWVGVDSC